MLTGPTANNFTVYSEASATLDIPAYAGVLDHSSGGNGPLSAVLVSQPMDGSVSLNSDGSFDYTNTTYPEMGMDSFQYEAYDGSSYSAHATVTISFWGNYAPQTSSSSDYSVKHGTTLTVSAASGVLADDTDPNGLHLTAVLETNASHGSVTLNSDGSLSYTPVSSFAGTDWFTYEAFDGNFYSVATTVDIDVTETPPMSYADEYSLLNNQTLNVSAANGVLANDTGDSTLIATLYSQPAHGSLTFNSDGSSICRTSPPTFTGTAASCSALPIRSIIRRATNTIRAIASCRRPTPMAA